MQTEGLGVGHRVPCMGKVGGAVLKEGVGEVNLGGESGCF